MDMFTSDLLASDHPFTIFSPDEISESILSIYHMLKHAVKNQCGDIVITQNGEEYLRDGHLLL